MHAETERSVEWSLFWKKTWSFNQRQTKCVKRKAMQRKRREEFWEFVIYLITLRIGVFHNLLSMKNQPKLSMEDNLGVSIGSQIPYYSMTNISWLKEDTHYRGISGKDSEGKVYGFKSKLWDFRQGTYLLGGLIFLIWKTGTISGYLS